MEKDDHKITPEVTVENEPYEVKKEDIPAHDTENVMNTNAILDSLLSDKSKVITIVGVFILFLGSYLSFWGVNVDGYGRMSQGNLLSGYMLGGMIGKLCIIVAVASTCCICFNKFTYAWYGMLVSTFLFVLQSVIIAIFGTKCMEDGVKCHVYPGMGSFICVIGIMIMLYFSYTLWHSHGEAK
jgi:hypothetical protein